MNIELTQEQAEAYARGEVVTITPKPKQWEPCAEFEYGFEHLVNPAMTTQARLLAYVYEFGGDWIADWNDKMQEKYHLYQSSIDNFWQGIDTKTARILGAVYMSRECAIGLVAKLESGEVVL